MEYTSLDGRPAKKAGLLRKVRHILYALGFLAGAAALLLYSNEVKNNVAGTIIYCLTALVPSLFPFMALTAFAVRSPAADILGRPLGFLSKYIFHLPPSCIIPILLSFLGGYPAGARGASLLLEQKKIDDAQAGRMMLFCVNPGVAFVVTFLGGCVLGSLRLGWLLFFSVTASSIIIGIITGIAAALGARHSSGKASLTNTADHSCAPAPIGGALMSSVADASSSVMKMCACVVLFSGINGILHGCGIFQHLVRLITGLGILTQTEAAAFLSFLIEVTGGAGDSAALQVSPSFFAFGLAFGGLCVHLQVFSFFSSPPVKKRIFLLFRFLHGFLSAICFSILIRLIPGAQAEVMATLGITGYSYGGLSHTVAGGLSLLLMCAAFLVITGGRVSEPRRKPDCESNKNVLQ